MKRILALALAFLLSLCFLSGGTRRSTRTPPSSVGRPDMNERRSAQLLCLCPACSEEAGITARAALPRNADWEFGICEKCGKVFDIPRGSGNRKSFFALI